LKLPPSNIKINKHLTLRVSRLSDAQEHLEVLNANREHLMPFMPWAHFITEVQQYEAFIGAVRANRRTLSEFGYQITLDGKLIGRISMLSFDTKNMKCEIGYWITSEHEGKGMVKLVTKKMIEIATTLLGFHRVEIRCAVGNSRSANIPKRLGFVYEGLLRHAEKSESGWRDLELYAWVVE
jgi:ribosomal-protein-serine acetyltransferase